MAEKRVYGRSVQKHDSTSNWSKATNFKPLEGELIIYDNERIKIGDGSTLVGNLKFIDEDIKEDIETLSGSIDDVDSKLVSLVGDTKVSEQIAAANIIYVGPDKPTDSNIKVWINTVENGDSSGPIPMLPRLATVTLDVNGWSGSATPYSQVVSVNTVTATTKVDLQPTAMQIVSLQNDDIALMAENVDGVVTIYSFGGKPSDNMVMQALLTEVTLV